MKRSIFCVLFIVFCGLLFAQTIQQKESDVDGEMGTLTIRTNVSESEVYINGEYKGRTPLKMTLLPGIYNISLEKTGYFSKNFSIIVTQGNDTTLYAELERKVGYVDFIISEPGATIYVDGTAIVGKTAALDEGVHSIEVKLFGYEIFRDKVTVFPLLRVVEPVVLKKAFFDISNFYISPQLFNPNNPGLLGSASVFFSVTSGGTATVNILDSNHLQVATYDFPTFTTWSQSWVWDGKINGVAAPEGKYTIELIATEEKIKKDDSDSKDEPIIIRKTTSVSVDYSVKYPLYGNDSRGLGIGLVPNAILFPKGTIYNNISIEPIFLLSNKSFFASPMHYTFSITPLSWLELSVRAGIWFRQISPTPLSIGASVKAGLSCNNFSFAGIIQYEYISQYLYGIRTDAGLRGGLSFGWQFGEFNLNYATSYIFGPTQGLLNSIESSFENSVSLFFQHESISVGLWGILSSAVGKPNTATTFIWNEVTGGGVDFSFLLPHTNILMTTKVSCLVNPNQKDVFLKPSFGFTILL